MARLEVLEVTKIVVPEAAVVEKGEEEEEQEDDLEARKGLSMLFRLRKLKKLWLYR